MFAFGAAVTDTDAYERCALAGFQRAAEPDSKVMAHQATGSLQRNYNVLLEKAAELDGLEGLVLVHQDVEIADSDFCARVRPVLADHDVAVVGCVGAIGVRSPAWWEGSLTWAGFTQRYSEFDAGEFPGYNWDGDWKVPPYCELGEVETVDGIAMVLSRWAVENLRFDESLGSGHGYDFDLCCQARAAGKKVVTADFKVIHHHDLVLLRDRESWIQSHMRATEKWEGVFPAIGGGDSKVWEDRARRAEAELSAVRLDLASTERRLIAQGRMFAESRSWRMTAPLRRAAGLMSGLRARLRRR